MYGIMIACVRDKLCTYEIMIAYVGDNPCVRTRYYHYFFLPMSPLGLRRIQYPNPTKIMSFWFFKLIIFQTHSCITPSSLHDAFFCKRPSCTRHFTPRKAYLNHCIFVLYRHCFLLHVCLQAEHNAYHLCIFIVFTFTLVMSTSIYYWYLRFPECLFCYHLAW